jgi:hypothetical protein
MPGIGLVEEPMAVAGERLSVQTAKIVESQEATRIDGYSHVPSIDFLGKLVHSIVVGSII